MANGFQHDGKNYSNMQAKMEDILLVWSMEDIPLEMANGGQVFQHAGKNGGHPRNGKWRTNGGHPLDSC
jgi:hypothetical protein